MRCERAVPELETRRTTVRDVRRANRASLLTDLFHGGRQSRQQLGDSTALSQASVSNLIGEMIDEGLVEEAGLVGSDGGRPRVAAAGRPALRLRGRAPTSARPGCWSSCTTWPCPRLATAEYPLRRPADPAHGRRPAARPACDAVVAEAGVDADRGARLRRRRARRGRPGPATRSCTRRRTGWDAVPLGALLRAGTDVPIFVENGAKTLGPGGDVVRRRPGRPARGHRAGRLRRRRGRGDGRLQLPRCATAAPASGATPPWSTAAARAGAARAAAWRRTSARSDPRPVPAGRGGRPAVRPDEESGSARCRRPDRRRGGATVLARDRGLPGRRASPT